MRRAKANDEAAAAAGKQANRYVAEPCAAREGAMQQRAEPSNGSAA